MSIDPSITATAVPATSTTVGNTTTGSITWPGAVVPNTTLTIPAPTASAPRMFDEQALNKARQDERDKLYGRLNEQSETLNAMQAKLAALEEARAAEQEAIAKTKADAEAQAAAALKAQAEAEMSAKDFAREQTEALRRQLEEIESRAAQERALFEKDRAFSELQQYTQAQVAAHQGEIAPELLDLVGGNTKEEVDASIALLASKSSAIAQTVAERSAQARQANLRGVSPTGRPNIGPLDTDPANRTLTAKDITEMPMADYAANRQQLLAAASNHVRTNGLYG